MPNLKKCPLNRMKQCAGEDCMLWLEFAVAQRGEPNNAPSTMQGGCALAWTPVLQYDANFKLLGNQQAIESFRNETVKRHDAALALAADRQPLRVIHADDQD